MIKCVFPVAGYGSRFFPVTKAIPKEMIPLLNKPLIQYAIEESHSAGLFENIFVTSKYKQSIKDYLSLDSEFAEIALSSSKSYLLEDLKNIIKCGEFKFINQEKMLGLGHAIYTAKDIIKADSFGVVLPDDFCVNPVYPVMKQMLDLHKLFPKHCIIAVEEVDSTRVCNYGIIEGATLDIPNSQFTDNVYIVSNMIEKPREEEAPSNLAIIGRYILSPQIFDKISITVPDNNNEIQITDALNLLAKESKVIAYKYDGIRYDCGAIDGFIKASNYLYSFKLGS